MLRYSVGKHRCGLSCLKKLPGCHGLEGAGLEGALCGSVLCLPVLLPLLCPWAGDGLPLCPCHELGDGCNNNDVICLVDLHAT